MIFKKVSPKTWHFLLYTLLVFEKMHRKFFKCLKLTEMAENCDHNIGLWGKKKGDFRPNRSRQFL
jgi:hypothetical protein